MVSPTLFSKASDIWGTPTEIFKSLNEEFSFTLDPCALSSNAKLPKFFTPDQDGLSQSWQNQRVFCNPPYSQIRRWIEKSYEETQKRNCPLVVLLIPSRTDTSWFHTYLYGKAEIRFIRGRLKFTPHDTSKVINSAPFPSMVCILRSPSVKKED